MKINITPEVQKAIKSLHGAICGTQSFQDNKEHRLKLLAENRKNMAKRRKEKLLDQK